MTSTLRVTASNKFTLFDLKTRQIAVRNAFWKDSFVRIADIYVFSPEGQLCNILSFKQWSIDVNGYQQCQAEELLLIYPNRVYFDFFKERLQAF